jgi:hypothetical protein
MIAMDELDMQLFTNRLSVDHPYSAEPKRSIDNSGEAL